MSDTPSSRWAPDAKTLLWAFGRAHESDIKDAIREDVTRRGRNLGRDSDAYWRLIAEAAIESVLYDLMDKAREDGTTFPPDSHNIP